MVVAVVRGEYRIHYIVEEKYMFSLRDLAVYGVRFQNRADGVNNESFQECLRDSDWDILQKEEAEYAIEYLEEE